MENNIEHLMGGFIDLKTLLIIIKSMGEIVFTGLTVDINPGMSFASYGYMDWCHLPVTLIDLSSL